MNKDQTVKIKIKNLHILICCGLLLRNYTCTGVKSKERVCVKVACIAVKYTMMDSQSASR